MNRPARSRSIPTFHAAAVTVGFLAVLAGCVGEDQIERYTVEKPPAGEGDDESPPLSAEASRGRPAVDRRGTAGETDVRLLGAIVPHGPRCWFFKLIGPAEAVAPHAEQFTEFVKSIGLDAVQGVDAPTWDLPEGWQEEQGSGMRFATIKLDRADPSLELSVIRLSISGDEDSYVLSNVNRWRRQVGQPEIEAGQLAEETTQIDLEGGTAIVVDVVGPAVSEGRRAARTGVNAGGGHEE